MMAFLLLIPRIISTLGKKTDTASATSTSSQFSWIKYISSVLTGTTNTTNTINTTTNTINTTINNTINTLGVKTFVCPTIVGSGTGTYNFNLSNFPKLAQIVGFEVGGLETIMRIIINSVIVVEPSVVYTGLIPRVINTATATMYKTSSGSFNVTLTLYYRI